MIRHLGLTLAVTFAGSLLAAPSQAQTVYFQDGFETQSDPLGTPPVGVRWSDVGVGDNHSLVTSPVFAGTKALEAHRDGSNIVNLLGVGNAGALVAGNTVEYIFHINQVEAADNTTHNFNAPIQNNIGFSNGVALLTYGTLDGGSENYFVSNGGAGNVNTGITIPRNTAAYDTLRFVLYLTEPSAGQLGGTYDVFIDVDDVDGIATNFVGTFNLNTQTVPGSESTNPAFRIQRGPSTSDSLYDEISITQVIPEPGSIALLASGGLLMLVRRRRGK